MNRPPLEVADIVRCAVSFSSPTSSLHSGFARIRVTVRLGGWAKSNRRTGPDQSTEITLTRLPSRVILRADNTSRLVDEYVGMLLRRYSSQRIPPKQGEIVAVRQSLELENAEPALALLMSISSLVRSSQPYSKAVAAEEFDV